GAEVGCVPSVDKATAERWAEVWGFPVPDAHGWTAAEMVEHSADGDVDVFWIVGGNFLETLPDPDRSLRSLRRPRLRIHQDIAVSSSMLADGDGDVVILPATTRYESEGGGTETTTERRIVFSPEIPGRRIGRAMPEWQVFGEVVARARPDRAPLIRFQTAALVRDEIARAVPLYAGIERLRAKGDQVQWGGRTLYADGWVGTTARKAPFSVLRPPASAPRDDASSFRVSTRRGKQFNSMVQRDSDPLTGADREDVLMSAEDLTRLNLRSGDKVRLRSANGVFTGRAKAAPIRPGNLEV